MTLDGEGLNVYIVDRPEGVQAKLNILKEFQAVYTDLNSPDDVKFQDILLKDPINGTNGVDLFLMPNIFEPVSFRLFRKTFPSV